MTHTYRIRYSLTSAHGQQAGSDVRTVDVQCDLEGIPGQLPPGAYIMYVEDLTARQDVHWTRWPRAYRPGFGG